MLGPALLRPGRAGMLSAMWLERRLLPGAVELGMAFAGLVLGYLVVAVLFSLADAGPLTLLAGPLITGVAAAFYALAGPKWNAAAVDEADREPLPPQGPPRVTTTAGMVLALVVGLAVALAGSVVLGMVFEQLGLQVQEQSTVLDITQRARTNGIGLEAVMLVTSALLLAPVAEEWLFRGLLFRRVAATSGRRLAYVVSAVGFAAIHGNPAGFVVYLWLGLVFAAVIERTDRLWVAVGVHMGNNAFVLGVLFVGSGGGG